jgi:hypothetical protein
VEVLESDRAKDVIPLWKMPSMGSYSLFALLKESTHSLKEFLASRHQVQNDTRNLQMRPFQYLLQAIELVDATYGQEKKQLQRLKQANEQKDNTNLIYSGSDSILLHLGHIPPLEEDYSEYEPTLNWERRKEWISHWITSAAKLGNTLFIYSFTCDFTRNIIITFCSKTT